MDVCPCVCLCAFPRTVARELWQRGRFDCERLIVNHMPAINVTFVVQTDLQCELTYDRTMMSHQVQIQIQIQIQIQMIR